MTEAPSRSDRPTATGWLGALHLKAGDTAIRVANILKPRLSLGVRLMAFDAEGRVFLVRHSYLPGSHLVGGAVDPGESCRTAAEREAREEGGLVLPTPPELFHVYWNPVGGRRDHVVLFIARGARETLPRPRSLEIRTAGFHPVDALPDDTTPATRARIAELFGGAAPSDRW